MPADTAVARLTSALVDGDQAHPLAEELTAWLVGSRRFRSFVESHRDKIRKKLRGAADADARRDVRAELRIAQLLIADRRIGVAFEAYGSTSGGPDFTVTVRGERAFNLEVTRLRGTPGPAALGATVLTKLRQLPPSTPNAVLVAIEGRRADALDVRTAIRALRARADAKDEAFFISRGFDGSRGFYQRFLRLGAVLTWCEGGAGEDRAVSWANVSARIAIPDRALRACVHLLRAA